MNQTISQKHSWVRGLTLTLTFVGLVNSPETLSADLVTVTKQAAELKAIQDAISPDDAVAQPAWAELRAEGPAGLEQLRTYYRSVLAQNEPKPSLFPGLVPLPNLTDSASKKTYSRLLEAENAIGAQYDNVNGLYWFTDLAAAKLAAQAAHKPILSLRLLGKLDEPLTCANSRFFRITLYANREIAQALHDKFILHWETFLPVPVVTVDFGNGRKLVRTITGNSIHYILSPEGDLVDALPGLYSPDAFLSELTKISQVATSESQDHFYSYRQKEIANLEQEWKNELVSFTSDTSVRQTLSQPNLGIDKLKELTDEKTWNKMAALYPVTYDSSSITLIRSKFPSAETALPLAVSKAIVEDPVVKAIDGLQNSTSLDTVKDNLCLRSQVLQLSLQGVSNLESQKLDTLNDRVYAEVFLTPKDDPYLGLEAPGTISALDNGGELSLGK